jgi:hypothetical protein
MEVELKFGGLELEIKGWRGLVTLLGIGLLGATIVQELARPPATRTWRGYLLGLVPYDLRPPTLERLRATVWNPSDPRLLVETPFGVGWSVNVARLTDVDRPW